MASSYAILIAVLLFPGGLFALALGLALKGADRRVAARLQGRVGPPLAQPFFDIVKLGFKRTMVPDQACETVFLVAPLVGTASMLVAVVLIPIAGVYSPDPQLGNLLVLLYLLAIPGVALMVAGSASGSPYGAIGFSREMALMLAYEGPIVLVVDRGRAAHRARRGALADLLAHRNRALSASARRFHLRPRDVARRRRLRLLLSGQSRHRALRHPRGRNRSARRPAARVLRPGARPVQGHVGAESRRGPGPWYRAVHAAAAYRRRRPWPAGRPSCSCWSWSA